MVARGRLKGRHQGGNIANDENFARINIEYLRVTGSDKALVLTIASQARASRLTEELAPLLTSHGLLLTMWDVEVIRGERF